MPTQPRLTVSLLNSTFRNLYAVIQGPLIYIDQNGRSILVELADSLIRGAYCQAPGSQLIYISGQAQEQLVAK